MSTGDETIHDEGLPARARFLAGRFGPGQPESWAITTVREAVHDPSRDTSVELDAIGQALPPRLSAQLQPAIGGPGAGGERYALGPLLGHGGGGMVFTLSDRHTRREVALKVLHPQHAGDARRNERLVEEACVTASLEHPNILPIYDLDRAVDGRSYFTMRLARGRSLQELITTAVAGEVAPAISAWSDRVDIMLKVCDAVAYAHHRRVIHQ